MPKISDCESDVRLGRRQRQNDNGPGPRKLPRKLEGFAGHLGGWRITAQDGPIQPATESSGGLEGELRFSPPPSPVSSESSASQPAPQAERNNSPSPNVIRLLNFALDAHLRSFNTTNQRRIIIQNLPRPFRAHEQHISLFQYDDSTWTRVGPFSLIRLRCFCWFRVSRIMHKGPVDEASSRLVALTAFTTTPAHLLIPPSSTSPDAGVTEMPIGTLGDDSFALSI
ncbi:hypothetical protein BT96DRAFT_945584 [Gymnopus androsaceus JB14]|uniref:Uncharacterized protein n=1 Tax=Gymnopus androsaceus JB14 TaxID=1447944 RepID=A0A6A4H1Y0_9AGAR|nr:hypothetical protein BT96DRAFT_945584 [Gymnopus androsaceus JB14]